MKIAVIIYKLFKDFVYIIVFDQNIASKCRSYLYAKNIWMYRDCISHYDSDCYLGWLE